MKKIIYALLKSRLARKIINPRFGKITKVEGCRVCLVPSADNFLGDIVLHNFIVQQLQARGYNVSYGLSAAYYNKYKFFFEHHCLANDLFILPGGKAQWPRFIQTIRKKKIKAVILDEQPLVSSVYFYFAGVPVIITPKDTKSVFCSKEYKMDKPNLHYTDLVNIIAGLLGNDEKEKREHTIAPFLPFKKAELKEIKNRKGLSLAMHIGGGNYWNRKWPSEKFMEICKLFMANYGGAVYLLGGKEEFRSNESFKNILVKNHHAEGKVFNFSGVDLHTTATVISSADVYIGNDSGPLHIAVALNKRVIAIYGPSPIQVYTPVKYDKQNIAVYSALDCVPCNSHTCMLPEDKKYSCLTDLPTYIVWQKLEGVIEKEILKSSLLQAR